MSHHIVLQSGLMSENMEIVLVFVCLFVKLNKDFSFF